MFDGQSSLTFETVVAATPRPIIAVAAKAKRDAIKAAGGEAYAALLAHEKVKRAKYRKDHPDYWKTSGKDRKPFKSALCANARARGRKRGIGATITAGDLIWPTNCPVLGIELDYPTHTGMRGRQHPQSNWPSLDRWDSTKGYVVGNVFVISYRANTLKNSATYAEILQVAKYLSRKPR